jgi:hypothetical protein
VVWAGADGTLKGATRLHNLGIQVASGEVPGIPAVLALQFAAGLTRGRKLHGQRAALRWLSQPLVVKINCRPILKAIETGTFSNQAKSGPHRSVRLAAHSPSFLAIAASAARSIVSPNADWHVQSDSTSNCVFLYLNCAYDDTAIT